MTNKKIGKDINNTFYMKMHELIWHRNWQKIESVWKEVMRVHAAEDMLCEDDDV